MPVVDDNADVGAAPIAEKSQLDESAVKDANLTSSRNVTNLELTRMNQDFYNSSIEADVGVTCDSITLFGRYLAELNARRPEGQRKDDDTLTLRLLHAINGNLNSSMHLEALKEIRAPPDKRSFQNTVTGMRDFSGAVKELDLLWRALFTSDLIKPVRIHCDVSGPMPVVNNIADIYTAPKAKETQLNGNKDTNTEASTSQLSQLCQKHLASTTACRTPGLLPTKTLLHLDSSPSMRVQQGTQPRGRQNTRENP